MEDLRKLKEDEAFSDPSRTRDVSISASLGAMRALVGKLDPPQGCYFESVKDGMHHLKEDVKKLSSCLDVLSEVEDPPPTAKCWMNEARDLSYEMEDYIDSLLFVQPAGPSLFTDDMEDYSDSLIFVQLASSPLVANDKETHKSIAAKVSGFSKYVQESIERHRVYVVPDSSPRTTLTRRSLPLDPMLPTPYEDIVIDGRMNEFIDSLANDKDQQLKMLSILGSPCLGKTTLARVLYNKLGKQYSCQAFIRVSKKPDMKRIFCDMLSQLHRQGPLEYRNEVDLIDSLSTYLRNKRYLIIIDDVWAASVWDIIYNALPKGNHGSRIITTTQIEDVALTCCCYQSECCFEMKPLDDHLSRQLFFNRLFGSESNCPKQFKEILNEIVSICGGLPLATISIASLVASQPVVTTELLRYIHKSLGSCFSANPISERTRQALNVSFNNLPQYLKTCLMYLSMYQEAYTFCKDDLVKQWVAEGFIDTTEGQDLEIVAESYLHQLIGRRFIQPIRINYNNEVLSYAVHDVVHDLIAHKAGEDNFIMAINYNQKNVALSHKVRRLSLHFGDARYAKTPANIIKSKVRSLAYSGSWDCMPCIREFKLLRVLILQISFHGDYEGPIELTGISELFQLKYLKIASNLCIKFPDHMGGLQRLETLDIMDALVLNFAWDMDLPRLLHLSLPFERSLLNGIHLLKGFGRMNYLQDLQLTSCFTTAYDLERNMEALGLLIRRHGNLKTVVVAHGNTVKTTRIPSVGITSLDHLLSKKKKRYPSLHAMASPPLLQRFEFSPVSSMPFFRIPKWVRKLDNLCILKITVKILVMDCVSILRGLRSLSALSLYVWKHTGGKIIFDKAGFSALKYFKLRFMTGISWIKFEEDAMPNLLKLKLTFNAIPAPMDTHHYFFSKHPRHEQYKQGNALISIEHMPGLREISAKFEGAAADLEYIKRKRIGISNDPSNPEINMKWVEQKQQTYEILQKDPADETLNRAGANKRLPESSSRLHGFALEELMYATSNFSAESFLASGFYKGSLKGNLHPGLPAQQVTVKCINMLSDDHEWLLMDLTELECLARVRHPHLVKLLGFCDYYNHRMLVYENMPEHNLKKYLEKEVKPPASASMTTRLKMAVGAAKGLAFLHEADQPMVHGDFKASNILLRWDHTAQLFGFRLLKENPGYVMAESDVYNFGVMLLELLAGRSSMDQKRIGSERNLVEWSRPYLLSKDNLHYIIDPSLEGQYSLSTAWSTATIACRCLQSVPEERPLMRDIVDALEPLLQFTLDKERANANLQLAGVVVQWKHKNNMVEDEENESYKQQPDKILQEEEPDEQSNRLERRPPADQRIILSPEFSLPLQVFTMEEIKSATRDFSGENFLDDFFTPYHAIYKGTFQGNILPGLSSQQVAIMCLEESDHQLAVAACNTRIHPHLLKLVGFCNSSPEMLLVYEYMPRGSLQYNFTKRADLIASLAWLTRLSIIAGVAKGMAFLHEPDRSMTFVNFGASNILLDSDYAAKLWGFSTAKEKHVMMSVIRAQTSDVYNFGLVLVQLLAGPQRDLHEVIATLEHPDKLHSIMDPSLEGQCTVSAAWNTVVIARRCLDSMPEERPSMRDVALALDDECTKLQPVGRAEKNKDKGKIVGEEEVDEYDETMERPSDQRISTSSKPSSRMDVSVQVDGDGQHDDHEIEHIDNTDDPNEIGPSIYTESNKAKMEVDTQVQLIVDPVRAEIIEMMDLVHMDGAEYDSDEYFYASQLFTEVKYRDAFNTFKKATPQLRLKWINKTWDDRGKN